MTASLTINEFDPLIWVNEYAQLSTPIDDVSLKPILHFALMWNLFERDACKKAADPTNIENTIQKAFEAGALDMQRFSEHLAYFRERSRNTGIDDYLRALKMTNAKAQHLVHGVLDGSLNDPNNVVHALMLIIHRIRNNLFHGEKDVASLHSQTDLFRTANSLLATFLSSIKSTS